MTVPPSEKSFLGHPRGLVICFLTEMWERFSYYGMRGLLLLYLTQHFLFSDERSNVIYGAYIALVYIMSIVGGVLSDKYLGQRKAVTFGAILLVLGHFGMAFEGSGSRETLITSAGNFEVQAEGRDNRRQLFVDYEGETRRVVFDSTQFATLGDERILPVDDAGVGDYQIQRRTRGFIENICALVNLGCAGPEPETVLVLNGERLHVEETDEGMMVERLGQMVPLVERSETDILVLADATTAGQPDTSSPVAVFEHGSYSTVVVQQSLYVNILYISLALIIAGVGFLKPNISTIVGDLYPEGDPRRDGGFTLFYMGINLGSFLATWTCGILGIVYGWAWGFGAAGLGMLFGLIVFQWGQPWLDGKAEPPSPEKLREKVLGVVTIETACYTSALLIVAVSVALLMNAGIVNTLAMITGIGMFVALIGYSIIRLKGAARTRMWAAVYFAIAQIPFWSLFEQAGSSLTLVTSRLVDTNIFGWNVPTPVFQSLNAGFIFLFAPLVAWLWVWLARRGWEPSTPVKFAIGVFGAGLGYLVLVGGMSSVGAAALTPVFFIFAIYWIHTMAELMLSPVGLSAMTKLAPASLVGLFMAAWFVYSGLGNAMSGVIAAAAGAETVGGQIIDVAGAKSNYIQVFSSIGYIGMVIGFLMLLMAPIVKRWMAETHIEERPLSTDSVGHN
ncbi:peptide ABC transporter [Hyphomonas sp. CACIAM 19H1]|uniref:peptide MFS transporter n=1 Tax=Hyphomonas sp. CACIAM 19H1 TaxID=1873716 RepID=UPI000DEDCD46|nr:peptide MFS transporter [Hyphomonas sp. CACIAM 19H1]AXE63864.1 peptide ABC transporter [Hyphomonas sp. CACIAM 19H1]